MGTGASENLTVLQTPLTVKHGPPIVFLPPDRAQARGPAFYRALRKLVPCVVAARRPAQLAATPAPGTETIFCGEHPDLAVRLLAKAPGVIAGEPEDVDFALTLGVPAILLTANPADTDLPSLGWSRGTPETLADECARLLYRAREQLALPLPAAAPGTPAFAVCLIADVHYRPFLVGTLQNLRETTGDAAVFHVLALDAPTAEFIDRELAAYPIVRYTLADLWSAQSRARMQNRATAHVAYASKPRLLARALSAAAETTTSACFYFDLDIWFARSPLSLVSAFGEKRVLLFPQWNDFLPASKRYGVFNAGMIGVRPGAESFLAWWADACKRCYESDPDRGYYVDQGFLDLAPSLFGNVGVYRRGDHNRAAWNERTFAESALPVASFHCAVRDSRGFYERKTLWDQIAAAECGDRSLLQSPALRAQCLIAQSPHWLALSRLRFAQEFFRRPNAWGLRYLPSPWFRFGLAVGARFFHPLRGIRARWRVLRGERDRFSAAENRAWIELQSSQIRNQENLYKSNGLDDLI